MEGIKQEACINLHTNKVSKKENKVVITRVFTKS